MVNNNDDDDNDDNNNDDDNNDERRKDRLKILRYENILCWDQPRYYALNQ